MSSKTAAEEVKIALTLLLARQLLAKKKKKLQDSLTDLCVKHSITRVLWICLNSYLAPYFTAFLLCKLGSLCMAVCFDKIL